MPFKAASSSVEAPTLAANNLGPKPTELPRPRAAPNKAACSCEGACRPGVSKSPIASVLEPVNKFLPATTISGTAVSKPVTPLARPPPIEPTLVSIINSF